MTLAFISYSHHDSEFVDRLCNDFDLQAVRYWRDVSQIRFGQYLDNEIENALRASTHFLVAVSEASVQSDYVRNEIEYASRHIAHIAPLRLDDSEFPLPLIRRRWLDFREDYENALRELLAWLQESEEIQDHIREIVLLGDYVAPSLTNAQLNAARDTHRHLRIIAGPGTGKSLVIEEHVNWLLNQGTKADKIWVVSFTRASSRELKNRIGNYLLSQGYSGTSIRVTTLHSLALTLLRRAKQLQFAVDPRVLDDWELDKILDVEFAATTGNQLKRCRQIRAAFEATFNTGLTLPPNYQEPEPPITGEERIAFQQFHSAFTQTYSCVLPGEIVRACVKHIEAATLDVSEHLDLDHLIVDEYQDLNPVDLQFTDHFAHQGVGSFIAGDDDQSIYAFRYAAPSGIQKYPTRVQGAVTHTLVDCFRCTPNVLNTAVELITANSAPDRLSKSISSVYAHSIPSVSGLVKRWRFKSATSEAKAIAASCQSLIEAGVPARDILILLSNTKVLLSEIQAAFEGLEIPVELPKQAAFIDTQVGRTVYNVLRIAVDKSLEDYLAHRSLLGLLKGIGPKICNRIREKTIQFNLNYLENFYHQLPEGVFDSREKKAIERARAIFQTLLGWSKEDTIEQRRHEISNLITHILDDQSATGQWNSQVSVLPSAMQLGDLLSYLMMNSQEQRAELLEKVYADLNLEIPEDRFLPQQVRVMTMHSAKGLDAQVVFIPGLEKGILPNSHADGKPGLLYEAARLLYVAISRAKAACILSYSDFRMINGKPSSQQHSRFIADLGGSFQRVDVGLSSRDAEAIVQTVNNMKTAVLKKE